MVARFNIDKCASTDVILVIPLRLKDAKPKERLRQMHKRTKIFQSFQTVIQAGDSNTQTFFN